MIFLYKLGSCGNKTVMINVREISRSSDFFKFCPSDGRKLKSMYLIFMSFMLSDVEHFSFFKKIFVFIFL